MSWLSTGTAKVVNGSTRVEFAGVDLIANGVQAGDAFAIRGSFNNEIARIVSATVLELVYPWISASADGAAYTIQPTVARLNDLNTGVGELLRTFTDVRDLAGRGIFGDGTVAAPGVRFASDQDTGMRRYGDNGLSFVTGGIDRLACDSSGRVGIGTVAPVAVSKVHVSNADASATYLLVGNANNGVAIGVQANGAPAIYGYSGVGLIFGTNLSSSPTEFGRFEASGNLLLGIGTSAGYGSAHRIMKAGGEGATILAVDGNTGSYSTAFIAVSGAGYSQALAAQWVGRGTTTNRSINAAGTINASGADYAEYILKAAGCGLIAKGDVCGVDRDGHLTKTWADAISFVIKSTDPSLVGGDIWDAEVGPKPEQPGAEPVEPAPPAPPAEDADDATIAVWRDAMAAYPAQVASYQTARAEWQKATDTYAKALPVWEAAHEKARQCVDRIAFCGQVPANVSGDFEVGDYIIAVASGAGIKAVAVKEDDMTLPQYMRRIGKVWAIRDGRAWIDVQHG